MLFCHCQCLVWSKNMKIVKYLWKQLLFAWVSVKWIGACLFKPLLYAFGLNPSGGRIFHIINGLHCTLPFSLILPLSQYDWNTARKERDVEISSIQSSLLSSVATVMWPRQCMCAWKLYIGERKLTEACVLGKYYS